MYEIHGLGDVEQAKYTAQAATVATTAVSAAVATHLITAGLGGPIGLAIAGVALGLEAIFARKGPQQKIDTTKIVNQIEPLLQQNLQGYLTGARTVSDQKAALANFDYGWSQVVAQCGQPQYGDPGQNCIHGRERGSTKGYDWFALYRDPIANDVPNPDSLIGGDLLNSFGSALSGWEGFSKELSSPTFFGLLLMAGLVFAAVEA